MAQEDIEQKIKLTYETNADEASQTVNDLTKNVDNVTDAQTKSAKASKIQGDAIKELAPAATSAVNSLKTMGKAMWAIVANPLGLILAAIAVTLGVLFLAFKSFQPLVDKVEQSFAALGAVVNVIKNTFIAVVTGTKSLGDAFNGLGGSMSEAAKEAIKLTKAQQDLDDAMEAQTITSAMARAEINKLNVMMKDRTKTEEERLAIAKKSEKTQEDLFNKEKDLADKQTNILANKLAQKYKFSREEKKLLFTDFEAAKALAESRGSADQELFDKFKDARLGQITIQDQATANLEKNQNKQETLLQAKADKEAKAAADAKARNDKAEAERLKQQEKLIQEKKDYIAKANAIDDELNTLKAEKEKAEKDRKQLEYETGLEEQLEKAQIQKDIQDNLDEEAKRRAEQEIQFQLDKDSVIARSKENLNNIIAGLEASGLAKTKAGQILSKGIALAQIGIDSAVALSKASALANAEGVAAQLAFPMVPGIGTVARVVSYAGTAASVIGNIARAKKLLSGNGGGGSSSENSQTSTPRGQSQGASATPQVNFQASKENQIGNTLAGRLNEQAPIRVTVLENDITKVQNNVIAKVVSNSF